MTDDLTHYMEAISRLRQRAERAEAERDRLRAVVDAVRAHRTLVGDYWHLDIPEDQAVEILEREAEAWQAVGHVLDQLDGSEDTGEVDRD